MNKKRRYHIIGQNPSARATIIFFCLGLVFTITACLEKQIDTPRLATVESQSLITSTPLPTPFFSAAPTATPGSAINNEDDQGSQSEDVESLVLWINETSVEHRDGVREMLYSFTSQSGIQIEPRFVSSSLLPELMQTAVISNTMPDLILHPVEYSIGWTESGLLDPQAATEAVEELGRDTFIQSALNTVAWGENGSQITALPSEGSLQLVIYRSDWFDANELDPPHSFDNFLIAAESIFDPENAVSGLVVPTESDLIETQQVFEHFALANGCEIIEPDGRVSLLQPACLEALDFYRQLINEFSPIGFQTNISAINAYLSGRTGIIVTTSQALPAIAGLDPNFQPACKSCDDTAFLIERSGITLDLVGNNILAEPATFGEITTLGITSAANKEAALEFIEFWFNEGYPEWLAINPERKIPIRLGTQDDPELFINTWKNLPLRPGSGSISDIFGPEISDSLMVGLSEAKRWSFDQKQGFLMSTLYEGLILAPLLQDMLSGYFTSSQTIIEMYQQVVSSIPSYSFPIEIAPTPESE